MPAAPTAEPIAAEPAALPLAPVVPVGPFAPACVPTFAPPTLGVVPAVAPAGAFGSGGIVAVVPAADPVVPSSLCVFFFLQPVAAVSAAASTTVLNSVIGKFLPIGVIASKVHARDAPRARVVRALLAFRIRGPP